MTIVGCTKIYRHAFEIYHVRLYPDNLGNPV